MQSYAITASYIQGCLHDAVTACNRNFNVLARERKMILQYSHSKLNTAMVDHHSPVNENGLKWTEINSFHSCQIHILNFWIYFYPIKISEFLKIHFNSYEGIKTKQFLFFSIKKKYADH